MKAQPKYKSQQQSSLFADQRSSRRPPEGTVAIGQLGGDDAYRWGVVSSQYVGKIQEPVTAELLAHGQLKFNTYCAPCHSRVGDGKGIVGIRAGAAFQPANLLEPRVQQMNDGELYSVASEGRRTMMGYRTQTSDHDRWAIVAYLRALHRANSGTKEDVPENLRAQLN
ncbi:MAG: cytochrome c [Acidobacteriaceae bacterium]|jgi:mono/diheme cytochrome c family protein|nr:cytochrome c [Acidobacteriaceae bacterium]